MHSFQWGWGVVGKLLNNGKVKLPVTIFKNFFQSRSRQKKIASATLLMAFGTVPYIFDFSPCAFCVRLYPVPLTNERKLGLYPCLERVREVVREGVRVRERVPAGERLRKDCSLKLLHSAPFFSSSRQQLSPHGGASFDFLASPPSPSPSLLGAISPWLSHFHIIS